MSAEMTSRERVWRRVQLWRAASALAKYAPEPGEQRIGMRPVPVALLRQLREAVELYEAAGPPARRLPWWSIWRRR